MRPMAAVSLVFGALAALSVMIWSHAQPRERVWEDGEEHGPWTVLYAGYGQVTGGERGIVLEPRAATAPQRTHAALVHTTEECLDPDVELTVHTEKQLRQGSPPNPWEVAWVLWNFRDDTHFYAVALKPNGWEVSKQDPAYPGNQRFIATGDERRFPIGRDYRVRISHAWPEMSISVDGEHLVTVVDEERPYRGGAIGLYTEDARVRFADVNVHTCT